MKNDHRHWLAANMSGTRRSWGSVPSTPRRSPVRTPSIFIKFRQNVAAARDWDMEMFAEVMGKPKE
jgi:6-oxocyclohex-1-ene-carbonyl-CoA hydrolase